MYRGGTIACSNCWRIIPWLAVPKRTIRSTVGNREFETVVPHERIILRIIVAAEEGRLILRTNLALHYVHDAPRIRSLLLQPHWHRQTDDSAAPSTIRALRCTCGNSSSKNCQGPTTLLMLWCCVALQDECDVGQSIHNIIIHHIWYSTLAYPQTFPVINNDRWPLLLVSFDSSPGRLL